MSILDLFGSGFRERNKDHFAAIVRIAMDDGKISDEEKKFLDRLAKNLDISEIDYKIILKDFITHPINPPLSYNLRLERLYDLSRMVYVDHIKDDHEEVLLRKIAIGLGFSPENVEYIINKALNLVSEGVNLDDFTKEIKNMNR